MFVIILLRNTTNENIFDKVSVFFGEISKFDF